MGCRKALYLIPKGNARRGSKHDVNFMTQEEIDAQKAADDEAAQVAKEAADAEFEAEIAELPEEEKTAKRTERTAKNIDDGEIDAEIAKEKEIADKAFKDREAKRKAKEAAGGADDDKPLTKKDLAEIEASAIARANTGRAKEIARTLATSPKEAELIFIKWQNRPFPEGLSLEQQLEETYAITHSKKLIGERNEAIRGLKSRDGVIRADSTTHFSPAAKTTSKMRPADEQGIIAAGYVYDKGKNKYEKKLPNGSTLVLDPVTKQTQVIPKAK